MSNNGNHLYEFDEYALDTRERSLRRNGALVQIVPKALDVLILLVNRNGDIVSREDLLENVWHETFVEEGNINYTISLLRKTLGEKEFIKTVPKQGYVFTADVRDVSQNGRALVDAGPTDAPDTAPLRRTRWVFLTTFALGILFVTSFVIWSRRDSPQIPSTQTANPEAQQAYTRGKMILASKSVEDREQKAIDEFQRAVTLDPTFAHAYAGLAEAFAATAGKLPNASGIDYYSKAKVAAQKALDLDSGLAEALLVQGWIKRNADWDFAGAEADLRKAIERAPENTVAHYRLARVLVTQGKTSEALRESNRAYELDPVSEVISSGRFAILEANSMYDEALILAEMFLKENKDNSSAGRALATFLYHKGEYARVIELCEAPIGKKSDRNNFAYLSLLAAALQKTGNFERADEILAQLEAMSADDTKALYSLAMNYAEVRRNDDAIAALQKCLDEREERMLWVRTEPRFANLRDDERFKRILAKLNL